MVLPCVPAIAIAFDSDIKMASASARVRITKPAAVAATNSGLLA